MATDYWQLDDTWAIGATEKAGATSIMFALRLHRRLAGHQVQQRGLKTILYLRHPITRLASAFAYFSTPGRFPVRVTRESVLLEQHPTIEQFIDAILTGRLENPHWSPQLAQHIPIDEVRQFETINETFPVPIDKRNASNRPKPDIKHRLDELHEYYREDLDAWHAVTES